MRKALSFAVVTLLSFAPFVRAQNASAISKVNSVLAVLIIPVPEPSIPALLPIDLLTVGALVIVFRWRATGRNRPSLRKDRDSLPEVGESAQCFSAKRNRSHLVSLV